VGCHIWTMDGHPAYAQTVAPGVDIKDFILKESAKNNVNNWRLPFLDALDGLFPMWTLGWIHYDANGGNFKVQVVGQNMDIHEFLGQDFQVDNWPGPQETHIYTIIDLDRATKLNTKNKADMKLGVFTDMRGLITDLTMHASYIEGVSEDIIEDLEGKTEKLMLSSEFDEYATWLTEATQRDACAEGFDETCCDAAALAANQHHSANCQLSGDIHCCPQPKGKKVEEMLKAAIYDSTSMLEQPRLLSFYLVLFFLVLSYITWDAQRPMKMNMLRFTMISKFEC